MKISQELLNNKKSNTIRKLLFLTIFVVIFAVTLCIVLLNSSCSNEKSNNQVTIGIANVTKCSEFYLYAREAAESTGANVVDLDQIRPSYISYEQNKKPKTYTSAEVEKTFKENHYGSEDYYDLTSAMKDSRGGLDAEVAKKLSIYEEGPSNVTKVMEGIDAVIIPGGEDVSPGLLLQNSTGQSIESEFQAANDVSDSLLATYCLKYNIPILGICRGMQLMCIASGGGVVDDISDYFVSRGMDPAGVTEHRMENSKNRYFVPHDVKINQSVGKHDSKLHKILGVDEIKNVPSWHHQLVQSVEATPLYVSGYTPTYGYNFIEAVELAEEKFAIGCQFHIELPIYLENHQDEHASQFMEASLSKKLFNALVEAAKQ